MAASVLLSMSFYLNSHMFYKPWIVKFLLFFFNYLPSLSFQSPLTTCMCLTMQKLLKLNKIYKNHQVDLIEQWTYQPS